MSRRGRNLSRKNRRAVRNIDRVSVAPGSAVGTPSPIDLQLCCAGPWQPMSLVSSACSGSHCIEGFTMDRLYRSRQDRMLAGVAGGLAESWDADPSLIRVIWALLVVFTGGIALLVYIVMAIVVPDEDEIGPVGATSAAASGTATATEGGDGREPRPPGRAGRRPQRIRERPDATRAWPGEPPAATRPSRVRPSPAASSSSWAGSSSPASSCPRSTSTSSGPSCSSASAPCWSSARCVATTAPPRRSHAADDRRALREPQPRGLSTSRTRLATVRVGSGTTAPEPRPCRSCHGADRNRCAP